MLNNTLRRGREWGRSKFISKSAYASIETEVVAWPLGMPNDSKYKHEPSGRRCLIATFSTVSFNTLAMSKSAANERVAVSNAMITPRTINTTTRYGTTDQKTIMAVAAFMGVGSLLNDPLTETSTWGASLRPQGDLTQRLKGGSQVIKSSTPEQATALVVFEQRNSVAGEVTVTMTSSVTTRTKARFRRTTMAKEDINASFPGVVAELSGFEPALDRIV